MKIISSVNTLFTELNIINKPEAPSNWLFDPMNIFKCVLKAGDSAVSIVVCTNLTSPTEIKPTNSSDIYFCNPVLTQMFINLYWWFQIDGDHTIFNLCFLYANNLRTALTILWNEKIYLWGCFAIENYGREWKKKVTIRRRKKGFKSKIKL